VDYLLNSNHAVALLNGDSRIVTKLTRHIGTGDRIAITSITVGELYFGAYNSRKTSENLRRIRELILPAYPVYHFDVPAAEEFGKIQAELRAKGRPIPTADVQIAAIAQLHGFTLLTSDGHFSWVDRLQVEDWLA
jgi:tRNA(fMet)-specific endonuclease VapC